MFVIQIDEPVLSAHMFTFPQWACANLIWKICSTEAHLNTTAGAHSGKRRSWEDAICNLNLLSVDSQGL